MPASRFAAGFPQLGAGSERMTEKLEVINVPAMVADHGAPGMGLYGSSKAAINLLTKAWAAEYGPSAVRVNVVSPGPTRTEGTEAMGEGVERLAAQAPAASSSGQPPLKK